MANSSFLLNLYETHLQNERKEHRKSLNAIKEKLIQIKDIKNYNQNDLSDEPIDPKNESTDSETLVAQTSSMNLNDDEIGSDLHLTNAVQYFVCVANDSYKNETVIELFKTQDIDSAVIYCNSTEKVDLLADFMESKGIIVKSFHKKTTKQKEKIIHQFTSGLDAIQAIITVKRVVNLKDVSFYINYDLPKRETYIKKVGSPEISGPNYVVINIITKSEFKSIASYEKFYGTRIDPIPLRAQNLL